jgi:putative membrane protein insertion efficiency factor
MKTLLVWFLRGYQLLLSPLLGQKCRFYPTCSNYAIEALRVHGAARGSLLAARRVCRCHPWNPGGVDFVPPPSPPAEPKDPPSPPAARGCTHP